MTSPQTQSYDGQPFHHEQFHDAIQAAHDARAKAMKDGFRAFVRATRHAFGA